MSRLVLIVPDLLAREGESILNPLPPALSRLVATGSLSRIATLPRVETPEALYLGMGPGEGQMRQGPLTVAALGADPPSGSTHFHLSLMSFSDGVASELTVKIPPEQEQIVLSQLERLNTKTLTIVKGSGLDHGLVWEGRGDMGTTPAASVSGHEIRGFLPEGDGEMLLRRLIDDSVNLLAELELNEERVDRGLPPLNLLWPWGPGLREPVPNLALVRGEPATVWSNSLRLRGLSRLVGYRHLASPTAAGINLRLEALASAALSSDPFICVLDLFRSLREESRLDEAAWFLRELDERLIAPLADKWAAGAARLTLLAPSSRSVGLGLVWEPTASGENVYPFDERSVEERNLPLRDLDELARVGLSSLRTVAPGAQ